MSKVSAFASELALTEPQVVSDLRTFVGRARAAEDGAVRLQASGNVLAAYVRILGPRMLGEATPTVLGLRVMPLSIAAHVDTTVSLASMADRLARLEGDDVVLPVPPTTVTETWAGVLPPRSGWQPEGEVPTEVLRESAKQGVREIAETVPDSPGVIMVNAARAAVWGRPVEGASAGVPAGAAFGALVLGFLVPGAQAGIFSNGRWTRLSTADGHVLVRRAAVL